MKKVKTLGNTKIHTPCEDVSNITYTVDSYETTYDFTHLTPTNYDNLTQEELEEISTIFSQTSNDLKIGLTLDPITTVYNLYWGK